MPAATAAAVLEPAGDAFGPETGGRHPDRIAMPRLI